MHMSRRPLKGGPHSKWKLCFNSLPPVLVADGS